MPQLNDRRYTTLFDRANRVFRVGVFLVHTYTRESRVDQAPDPYGEVVPGWGSPVPMLPCLLSHKRLMGLDPAGNPVVVVAVTMLVPPDDPLKHGDRVTNVQAASGRSQGQVVEPGPLLVAWAEGPQPFGPNQYTEAFLERLESGQ